MIDVCITRLVSQNQQELLFLNLYKIYSPAMKNYINVIL